MEIDAPILAFDGVSKHYRRPSGEVLKALDEVSLSIAPRKKLAITGRSGNGESTLLHLAVAIDVPSAGKVELLEAAEFELLPDAKNLKFKEVRALFK